MEKNKQFKNELLMETLRVKSSKTFLELAKNTRLSLLERRYNIDAVEKQTLQTALDNLQNNIQIKNRTHLVEKLESITRRNLLKFTDNANTNSLFISSDMFYLEILLDPQSGKVNDVKVHHECSNESESEPHLIEVLRKGDFIDFTQQLEGFQSIYQLNAESKIKSKAFIAIQALESDLGSIFSVESVQSATPEQLLIQSSVGLLQPRKGGTPMRLTFFVRPTELLNIELKRMDPLVNALQAANIAKKTIGNSVTINLEAASQSNKLQITPLLIKNGKNDFSYAPITVHNSAMLPAAFVLRLNQGMPLTTQFYNEIKRITNNLGVFGDEITVIKVEKSEVPKEGPSSLINLIVKHESEGMYENGQKGLFVNLADQAHCYFITDNPDLTGTMIKSIQFTEPSHVTRIIKLLRQQAIFNALIGSCVRKNNNTEDWESLMFEINIVSMQFIQIFVEHPVKQSIVTVELDLSDVKQIVCKINGSDQQFDSKLENYIYRVFQKTMSIPMVLRSLLKYWENEAQEIQRLHQKRLFNSGIYGAASDSKSKSDDKKEDGGKGDTGNSMESSYSGNRQNMFDICGINKNEIFFKANEQKNPMRPRQDVENNIDIFDQRSNKMSRVMSFEMESGTEDLMLQGRNSVSDDIASDMMVKKTSSKSGSTSQKSLDVFEFNDPSPPPVDNVLIPMQSPLLLDERSRKIPTPRASPIASSPFGIDKRPLDMEIIPMKSQSGEVSMIGQQASISLTPISNAPSNFNYEKPKSEKKKKRKREEGEGGSTSMTKKKSSDSLGSSPSKKSSSSSSSQLMGKPSSSFKKSPVPGLDPMGDLSFLNFGADQQTIPSPLPSPQSLLKGSSSSQANNRKNSLSAVINKLKSVNDAMAAPESEDKKSEYQIKSSGSDGIKITFNKTKSTKGSKSPKHSGLKQNTGLKPGVNSGPASKKSSQSSKSSSQKFLYQKSSSSGSLSSSHSTIPSPKSSSQPGKSYSKEGPFSGFSGTSNEMLKNMLNIASQAPFDKKFQIPKLSARGKLDEKPTIDEAQNFNPMHPRSAPSTPIQSSTPSPTMDFMREGSSSSNQFQMSQQNFFSNAQQQNKFLDQQRQNKKLVKSASSDQLFGESMMDKGRHSKDMNEGDYQGLFRSQPQMNESSVSMHNMVDAGMMQGQVSDPTDTFNDDIMSFIGNDI